MCFFWIKALLYVFFNIDSLDISTVPIILVVPIVKVFYIATDLKSLSTGLGIKCFDVVSS